MDRLTERKWNRAARMYNVIHGWGPWRRWAPAKRRLYGAMAGRVLFVAVGTGRDIPLFPPGQDIVAIDISTAMLARAAPRAAAYAGRLALRHADVHDLRDPAGSFDQVFTACTFCSVPRPIAALETLRRVLRPGGQLHMFEHTGSRLFPFRSMLDLLTHAARRVGPDLNRPTVANVRAAGFTIQAVEPVYLDVVKLIHAVAPA